MSEEMFSPLQEKKDSLYSLVPTETGFDVYIHNIIDEPHYYNELHVALRSLCSSPTIHPSVNIYICTDGGYLNTTLQILNSIHTAQANGVPVTTIADSDVASAGTLLLLAGDEIRVTPHALLLFHSGSSGAYGKYQDQEDKMAATKKQWRSVTEDYYSNVLTEEELHDIYENKRELYMTAEEFGERLNKLSEEEADRNLGEELTQALQEAIDGKGEVQLELQFDKPKAPDNTQLGAKG